MCVCVCVFVCVFVCICVCECDAIMALKATTLQMCDGDESPYGSLCLFSYSNDNLDCVANVISM